MTPNITWLRLTTGTIRRTNIAGDGCTYFLATPTDWLLRG